MAKILVIDDERSIRNTLKEILEYEGYEVDEASDGIEGLAKLDKNEYNIIFCDIKMPKMDGLEVLAEIRNKKPDQAVVMISGHGSIETAVEATKLGAYDFIPKPLDLNRLLITLRNALERTHLVVETKTLKAKVNKTQEIIGESPVIKKIKETIERVAPTDARILITGENGTGKELVARWVHDQSNRNKGPLVEVNCAAIPSELIESELFGHEKGSFTSAIKQRIGKFEEATGGTLFLDEIGDMDLAAQAKVLRVLQEHKLTRIGGTKEIPVDVRIVAATNKDLVREIESGRFRLDLYHRLGVIIIHVPSLNSRREDIQLLAQRFLEEITAEYKMPNKKFTSGALEMLKDYNWTGNIRELRNVIERLVILSGQIISESDVMMNTSPLNLNENAIGSITDVYDRFEKLQDFKDFVEKEFIERKLKANSWNITKTAEDIGIQRSHIYNKIEKYGFKRED